MGKRVLVLRHHPEDSPGLVGEAFELRGFALDVVMMNENSATPSVAEYDHLVILGSKHAVYDDEVEEAWFGRELDVIRDADLRQVPILGICFGAQALCRYFGGTVTPSSEPEIGWFEIEAVNGSRIDPGPWFEFHFDRCTLPEGAEMWARTTGAVQAFAVGANVGVQFHPEIDEVQLAQWFASGDGDTREFGLDPNDLLAETAQMTPAARKRAVSLVDLFLDHAACQLERRT